MKELVAIYDIVSNDKIGYVFTEGQKNNFLLPKINEKLLQELFGKYSPMLGAIVQVKDKVADDVSQKIAGKLLKVHRPGTNNNLVYANLVDTQSSFAMDPKTFFEIIEEVLEPTLSS